MKKTYVTESRTGKYKRWFTSTVLEGGKIVEGREYRDLFFATREMWQMCEFRFKNSSCGGISGKDFGNAFRKLVSFVHSRSGDFGKFAFAKVIFEPFLKVRLSAVTTPAVEHEMIDLVEKRDPSLSGKMKRELSVTRDDVLLEDYNTLKDHCFVKDTLLYWQEINFNLYLEAVNYVVKNFKFHLLPQNYRFHSMSVARSDLPIDTSSGYPLFKHKGEVEAIEDAESFVEKVLSAETLDQKLSLILINPVVVFHRFTTKLTDMTSQCWNTVTKIRQIFGVPFRVMLLETMIFGSVLKTFNSVRDGWHSVGRRRTEISHQVSAVRYEAEKTRRIVFCGDIKGIDKNLCALLVLTFFSVMMCVIPIVELNPIIFILAFYHVLTPVLTISGLHITSGGNVTGSKITLLMNTFCLSLVVVYFYLRTYGRPPTSQEFCVQGDDFILVIEESDIPKLHYSFRIFYLFIHPVKSKVVKNLNSDTIEYLGFNWGLDAAPDNPDKWWIARTCYPERYVLDRHGFMGRTFIRFCSIIFQIKRGVDVYDSIMYHKPDVEEKIRSRSLDPMIEFIDKKGRTQFSSVPLSMLTKLNWRAY